MLYDTPSNTLMNKYELPKSLKILLIILLIFSIVFIAWDIKTITDEDHLKQYEFKEDDVVLGTTVLEIINDAHQGRDIYPIRVVYDSSRTGQFVAEDDGSIRDYRKEDNDKVSLLNNPKARYSVHYTYKNGEKNGLIFVRCDYEN